MIAIDAEVGDVLIQSAGSLDDSGYLWIAAAYAVHANRVVLVLHNRFHKWVPPGGHLQAGESLGRTAAREFAEETGLKVDIVSATPLIHPTDANAEADFTPFYVDVEREGFRKPAIVHFFYAKLVSPESLTMDAFERNELNGIGLFQLDQLDALDTFDQVRSLSKYVLSHHPSPT